MTLIQARSLLGKHSSKYNDASLEKIIQCFEALIELGFQQFEKDQSKYGFDTKPENR